MTVKSGLLITNIGSPDKPTADSVRTYLKKFLSDPRVIEIPYPIWWIILNGFILRRRPKQSANLYQKIWMDEGSPQIFYSQKLCQSLKNKLNIPVVLGTHYGTPSIKEALLNLRDYQVNKIIVLPLFPQYSATTISASFDLVMKELKTWRTIPEIRTIHGYSLDDEYIKSICDRIKKYSYQHLLFSFHGIPAHCVNKGDPYYEQCKATVQAIQKKLHISPNDFSIGFQSRLGRGQWLQPYTDKLLQELPKRGINEIHVVCPGFAVDCLETLEEINIRGRDQFLQAGGKRFQYIPALNDSMEHVMILERLVNKLI